MNEKQHRLLNMIDRDGIHQQMDKILDDHEDFYMSVQNGELTDDEIDKKLTDAMMDVTMLYKDLHDIREDWR